MPVYDRLNALFMPDSLLHPMIEPGQVSAGELLADIGCGTGTHLLAIARQLPDVRLCGIDLDDRVLRMARKKSEQIPDCSIDWIVGSITKLPLQDNSAQLVVSSLVFHHLLPSEKIQALLEIRRVLAEQGTFILTDLARASNWRQRIQFLPVRFLDGWSRTACNASDRLPQLIREAGFSQVEELFACNSLLGTIRSYRATS